MSPNASIGLRFMPFWTELGHGIVLEMAVTPCLFCFFVNARQCFIPNEGFSDSTFHRHAILRNAFVVDKCM